MTKTTNNRQKFVIKFAFNPATLFSLFLVLYTQIYSQETRTKLLDEYLLQYHQVKNVPSASAGLIENGEITWLFSTGKADLENNVPITKTSLYRIASISKPITAVAVMQLWERGLVNLDADVRVYLPSFPEKKYKFTIRQLLNHTSGIRNYKEGEFDNKKFYSSIDEAIKVFAYDSLNFEPGTKYEYTSLGYTILASIIEKVSKTNFENYLKNNVLLPAKMRATRIDKQRELIPNRVRGYEKNPERNFVNAPLADLSFKVAGGGLLSTLEDLLLFSKALLDNKLIKAATLDLMTRKTVLKNGTANNYGLGFSLEYLNDSLKYFYHAGAGTGFTSLLVIAPKINSAAVSLINIRDNNLGKPATDILEMVLSKNIIKPKKTLVDELMKTYLSFGIDSTLQKLERIYNYDDNTFLLNEIEIQNFANNLVELNKTSDAIIYLKESLKRYKNSFLITVAIADAYLKDKNEGLALRFYKNALSLNKNDLRVNNLIKRLSNK